MISRLDLDMARPATYYRFITPYAADKLLLISRLDLDMGDMG